MSHFEGVYRRELRGVWQFVRRLGVRGPETDDLTHEVFLVAFKRWRDFDPSRSAAAWLKGIAWRVVADDRRLHRHRTEQPAQALPDLPAGGALHEQVASRLALQRLEAALDTLDADQRAVLVMHELEGIAAPEIAEAMRAPLPTTYSRLRLARARLAQALAEKGPS